jgi:hypothetical protein
MSPATYGSFPAAEALAAELDRRDDPALTRKVSRLLQDFNEGLRQLDAVEHEGYRARLALLWRDDFLARVAIDADLDKFVRNVLHTRAKRAMP